MSVMTMGFFPEIITIDAGDSITFINNSSEVHTVTFLSGNPPINPFSPLADVKIGGNVYNGTTVVSSGMLLPGQSYTLTFTNPGVYIYQCIYHAGMVGIVVVNPAGTPYPMTQAQYNQVAYQEVTQSLSNGESIFQQVNIPATPGPNGTTVWHVNAGLTTPAVASVQLTPASGSDVTGTAQLAIVSPGEMSVEVDLSGLTPGKTYQVQIFTGASEAGGRLTYTLNPVVGGSNGTGTSITTVKVEPLDPYIPGSYGIPAASWYVNVSSGDTAVSLGDVIAPAASAMRFLPSTLTIHVGDTVTWTVNAPDEVHTVTFVPQGMEIPEFGTPVSLIPAGGPVFNGSGYYNSGPLLPGQSYSLTFTVPGVYTYVCLLHDNMGMYGTIVVLPNGPVNSQQLAQLSTMLNQLSGLSGRVYNNSAQISQVDARLSSVYGTLSQMNATMNGLQNSTASQGTLMQVVNARVSGLQSTLIVLVILVIISLLLNVVLITRRR
ncbi:hypothetical protein HS1genome_1589 [Sulfodiicoccus acidiphilus]|uniref:Blue (type 1) copper domain-containing protein n=2 Tax=Sulfodiicoccus acidiphilus TaxID=1670455 RepID=A0A348B4U8_9CREN|nr:hypothetical protein HS1genome_1589 [Sulfodiicoccus acidiphilus]GGU01451.1 hypothetical protein GCM10007116_18340 [Sulfodiicoccus acidiphilus]